MREQRLIEKIDEQYVHSVATNERGGGIIERLIKKRLLKFMRDPVLPA
jgi:hypothetical protein